MKPSRIPIGLWRRTPTRPGSSNGSEESNSSHSSTSTSSIGSLEHQKHGGGSQGARTNSGKRDTRIPVPTWHKRTTSWIHKSQVDHVYYSDIIQSETAKEDKYAMFFAKKPHLSEVNLALRSRVVEWLTSATQRFQYSTNTLYLAVFLMDGFLYHRSVKPKGWALLGLTSLHLAGKMEEPNRVKMKTIWSIYPNMIRFQQQEILWMEMEILTVLNWSVVPPTPIVFTDLIFNSGRITFQCKVTEVAGKSLAYDILLKSLKSFELTPVKASLKAQMAIKLAKEFVDYNRSAYINEKSGDLTIPDELILSKAVRECFTLFRIGLLQQGSPMYCDC